MDMLALAFVFNLLASFVCFFAVVKMIFVVKGEKRKSINIKYYLYSLFFVSFYLLISGIPLFFGKSIYFLVISNALFRSLLLLGGMFLALIAINLSKFKAIQVIYFYLMLVVVFLGSLLTVLGISSFDNNYFTSINIENLMHLDNTSMMMGTLVIGISFTLSLLVSFAFYIHFALKQKLNEIAFGKAVMMAVGCFMFFGAGLSKYIMGVVMSNFTLTSIVASFLFMMGSIAFAASINYKGEKKKL